MTEERKKYMAGISKEEQIIRKQLRFYHREIVGSKWDLKYYKDKGVPWMLIATRENIHNYKVFIKALKKQLPAPKQLIWSCYEECVCPICEEGVQQEYDNYCPNCGQKLR